MSSDLLIYLAQINTSVGDIAGNYNKIIEQCQIAQAKNCDLIVFPELTICGYPCDDLWKKKSFVESCEQAIMSIVEFSKQLKITILVGSPISDVIKNKTVIRNSALLIAQGKVKKIINKKTLPNYAVFDEKRYFEAGSTLSYVEFNGQTLAILICEDFWDQRNWLLLKEQIFDNLIIINSSPFEVNKQQLRLDKASELAKTLNKSLIYVNQVGGQDSLVFDGSSFVINKNGEVELQLDNFSTDFSIIELYKNSQLKIIEKNNAKLSNFTNDNLAQIYSAMVLGLREYLEKNKFSDVLLGMSGGIDSALVAMIAVDAITAKHVKLYALPTKFNQPQSFSDALQCANNLGLELKTIEIEEIFQNMLSNLEKQGEKLNSLAQENLQSRLRGTILMSISNSTNALLISTGNKSELACGYATIYGDMNGAFNPIKDLYKTQIYQIVNWRNNNFCQISDFKKTNLIPQNIISKAPSAELRFNQKDSDSLPDYQILDQILFALIEEEKSISEIVKDGFDENLVKKISQLFKNSEYKRAQSVIGVRLSKMSFDKDRRYPITNNFNND
ncbi:MAG: NAD+ synthase [Alphaproteobacteria bacterium]